MIFIALQHFLRSLLSSPIIYFVIFVLGMLAYIAISYYVNKLEFFNTNKYMKNYNLYLYGIIGVDLMVALYLLVRYKKNKECNNEKKNKNDNSDLLVCDPLTGKCIIMNNSSKDKPSSQGENGKNNNSHKKSDDNPNDDDIYVNRTESELNKNTSANAIRIQNKANTQNTEQIEKQNKNNNEKRKNVNDAQENNTAAENAENVENAEELHNTELPQFT